MTSTTDYFETLMVDIRATPAQVVELEAAYAQTKQGFELVAARAKAGDNPVGLLLTLIRKGLHLKAAGQTDDERKGGGLFRCKVCGPIGNTNSEIHYENFPEHRDGKHLPKPDPHEWKRHRAETHRLSTVVRAKTDV